MIKKLRIKFICVIMTIVTVLLSGILGVVIYFTANSMEAQSISLMQSISVSQNKIGAPGKPSSIELLLPYFTVQISNKGEMIANSDYFDLSDKEYVQTLVNAAMRSKDETGHLTDYNLRYLKTSSGKGLLIVFSDTTAESITLKHMVYSCIVVFISALLVFWGISILLSRWVIKPVAAAWDQQRQFVSDASHELKTPLAVIMANAELAQSEDTPDEDRKKFAGSILSTTYQMRSLVENMLEMARVDNGAVKMDFARVDFSQLVGDAVLSFQLLYEEKAMGLRCVAREGIYIQGSEQHLYQVMDVLLDNALKYAAPGSSVSVDLSSNGRLCTLSVSNPGEPISKEDLKNIFKRFYRADKARAMNGSYGLGLSIAESIVEAHKGRIWAESGNGNNTFFVQIPTN